MFHVTIVYEALMAVGSGVVTSMFSDKIKAFFKLITGQKRDEERKEATELHRLQREREALDRKQNNLLDDMEKRIGESFTEIQTLKREINSLRDQHAIKDQMVSSFQSQIEGLLGKIERIEKEKENLRNDKDEECSKRMVALEAELRREIDTLSRELDVVKQGIQKPL